MTEQSDRGIRFDTSGSVAGSLLQVAATQAVNVHLPGRTALVPREVPLAVPFFTDRAEVMDALDRLCDAEGTRSRVAVLTGPRGVGKSAVVRAWAHSRAARYPDGQMYVDLGGRSSAAITAADVVASVLARLGVATEDLGGVLDGRVERLRSMVAGKRILIVCDHAVTASQIIPFVGSSADVVVTTTDASAFGVLRLHGARFVTVNHLDEPFASALFRGVAELSDLDDASEAVVGELVQRFCGRLPLAITLCGAMYADRPGVGGLAKWFEDLRGSDNPLSRIRVEGEVPLEEVFDEVYRGLDLIEARAYHSLGVLPAGRFTAGHVAAMLLMEPGAVDAVLSRLVDKRILTENSGFFEVHGLVQQHARGIGDSLSREKVDEFSWRVVEFMTACAQTMDRALVRTRLRVAAIVDLPEIAALTDPGAAHRWFDSEHSTALGYLRLAQDRGQWRHVCAMSEAWWSPAYARRQFDLALELSDIGAEVAEALEDPVISTRLWGQSALVCIATDEREEASDRLDCAYRWLAAIESDADRMILAASLSEWSGKLADATGDLTEANSAFLRARDFFSALQDSRGVAMQDYHLAKLAYRRGSYSEATDLVSAALRHLDPLEDSMTVARFSILRARCLIASNSSTSVHAVRKEMAELCASPVFSEAHFLLGQMYECVATGAEAMGDRAGMVEALEAAHAAFERCGSHIAHDIARRLGDASGT